jgi:hypothetical protein
MELKVYVNETDHVIAHSVDDAHKVVAELYGYDERQASTALADDPFSPLTSDATITIRDYDDGKPVTKTADEWVALHGRGLLCSTEC